jgi:hypothetical protein
MKEMISRMLTVSPGLTITIRMNEGKILDKREGHPIMFFSDHILVEFPTVRQAANFIAVCGIKGLHPIGSVMSFTDPVRICFRIQEFEVAMNRDLGEEAIVTHCKDTDEPKSKLCGGTFGPSTSDLLDVTCPRCYDRLRGLES